MRKLIIKLMLVLFIATSTTAITFAETTTVETFAKASKKKSKKKAKSSKKKAKKKTKASKKKSKKKAKTSKKKSKKKHVHKWEYCWYVEPTKGGTYEGKMKECTKCGITYELSRKFVKCFVMESQDEDVEIDVNTIGRLY